jgi:tryptophan-rich sensory protein
MSEPANAVAPTLAGHSRPRFHLWQAAAFWLIVNSPGWIFAWREELFAGFRSPAFRPPGAVFPVIWFVITVSFLIAGLRILNNAQCARRRTHMALHAAFWALYVVFPYFFFGLSSPIAGGIITTLIFAVALTEVILIWPADRTAAYLTLPLVIWTAYAALYIAPAQILLNPDPLFDTGAYYSRGDER